MTDRRLAGDSDWLHALADINNRLDFALFGYDTVSPDWEFRQRTLQDHLIYLVTDGSCVGEVAGAPMALVPGSFLWMQPGVRHTFTLAAPSADRLRLTVYFIRFRLGQGGSELALSGRTFQQWHGAWEVRELVDQCVDELGTRLPHRELRVRSLLIAICTAALRNGDADALPAGTGTLSRAQRQSIEAYARAHLAERPTPALLAEHSGLSHDYFTRLFTRTFAMPPRAWLVQERLRRGARSLADSLQNISEIAASLGYEDVSAFSHQFKQHYDLSPREFRRLQR